jgi:chromatin modification-related protein YNG2
LELTCTLELLQEITKETSRYIRHSLRSGAAPLTTKDEQIPQKIDQSYAEVDKLGQEKIQLAERLGTLIQRARTRLDYDLRRVLILQGEDPGQPAFVSTSRNPVQEMNESLRLAIAESSPIIPQQPVVLSTTQAPTQKSTFCHISSHYTVGLQSVPYTERKVVGIAATSSVKQPSPTPASTPVLPQRTRLAQQQSHRPPPARGRQIQQEIPGPDEDAEGEDDVEEGNGDEDEDNEDKTLYCFCQKMSYGEVCVTLVLMLF